MDATHALGVPELAPRAHSRGKVLGLHASLSVMVAWTGLCLLVVAAPFEALQPLVRLPGQSLTTVETILLAVLACSLAGTMAGDRADRWRTPLTWPWLALVGAGLVSALAAPANRLNALHMAGRFGLALGVFLVTVEAVTTRNRARMVVRAATVAGVVISALIVLEYAGNDTVLRILTVFRPGVSVVGAQVRAGGPFQYPTIASMYLEIVFALALGLLLLSVETKRLKEAALVMGALILIVEAIALTFTRAGLITMLGSLMVVGLLRARRCGFDAGARALALVAVLALVEIVSSRSVEALQLRLTTETQTDWFRAHIDAPLDVSLRTGDTVTVPVRVTNAGKITWDSRAIPPFRFSYHWLRANEDDVVAWEGVRTPFAAPVPGGQTVDLQVRVRAPSQPGSYRILWDVEQEHQLWFSSEPGARLVTSRATVDGAMLAPLAPNRVLTIPKARARPGRFVLWRAASRMFAAHPATGVGPDNFRLEYGRFAGIADPDVRMHSNNMYLEILAGTGVAGALAFAWLAWRAAGRFAVAGGSRDPALGGGIAAAGLAIAAHGLVDSFLGFTATYILIAVTLGLAVAACRHWGVHAYRV